MQHTADLAIFVPTGMSRSRTPVRLNLGKETDRVCYKT
jgi:hypothetical protein